MKSHMLLASQNMLNYDLMLPKDVVFRINLAWCNTLKELKSILSNNKKSNSSLICLLEESSHQIIDIRWMILYPLLRQTHL